MIEAVVFSRRTNIASIFDRKRLCGVVAASTAVEAARQLRTGIAEMRPRPVLELRLDFLRDEAELHRLLQWLSWRRNLPLLIATCRTRQGGGQFRGHAGAEIRVLKQAVSAGCRWCDVEIETVEQFTSGELTKELAPARLLVSAHNFRRLPSNLAALVARLERCRPRAIKIAAFCRSLAEARRLLALAHGRSDFVAIPMGEDALPARILALREGSALGYAAIAQTTAPGQLTLASLKRVYHLDRLFGGSERMNRRTRVYGVIGNPIAHSLSPLLHNTAFAARGINAVYLPFRVPDLRDFLDAILPLGIAGFSVTLPHKERLIRYLDYCEPLAAAMGAVNTVIVRGGKLCGYNTDFAGVLRAIGKRVPLRSSRVLLWGAGGSARATAFALAREGAAVTIAARRPAQARALARAIGGDAIDRSQLRHAFFDVLVNCTPVGMYPGGGSPLESRELNCRVVMDLVYRPRKTELLRRAERRGIKTISGVEMFLAQGVAQWEMWTGERAPEAAMRRAVLAALEEEETSANP